MPILSRSPTPLTRENSAPLTPHSQAAAPTQSCSQAGTYQLTAQSPKLTSLITIDDKPKRLALSVRNNYNSKEPSPINALSDSPESSLRLSGKAFYAFLQPDVGECHVTSITINLKHGYVRFIICESGNQLIYSICMLYSASRLDLLSQVASGSQLPGRFSVVGFHGLPTEDVLNKVKEYNCEALSTLRSETVAVETFTLNKDSLKQEFSLDMVATALFISTHSDFFFFFL